jgi:regulatory protein
MVRKITGLVVQKKNPQRVSVFLDGEFGFGLARIVAAWLQVGQELSEEKIAQLQAEEKKESAHQYALRLLTNRARSEAEVNKALVKKEYPPEVVEETLERLSKSGLLDDDRFAEAWVENRTEFRPRSKRALAVELRQRGLSQETIEKAVEEVDDEDLAYQAGLKQFRKLDTSDWMVFRKQLYNFLMRRGFNYDVIGPITRKIWDEIVQDDSSMTSD